MFEDSMQNRIEIITAHRMDAPDAMPAGSMIQLDFGNTYIYSYPSLWDREYFSYLQKTQKKGNRK
jgi:hypothetical protein